MQEEKTQKSSEAKTIIRGWLRLSVRMLRFYRVCDLLSGYVIFLMVIFSPWAFGTSQPWSIWIMNYAGYALGLLLAAKLAIRGLTGYRNPRWDEDAQGSIRSSSAARWRHRLARSLAALSVLVLAYCFTSALNARSAYHPSEARFEYLHFISWLPHSYDKTSSWEAFYKYLALGFSFWGMRDWLLGKTPEEERAERSQLGDLSGRRGSVLPERLRMLFWVLAINGGLLGIEGIIQRTANTGKLLFLVQARVNREAISQFGPYAYRSNAAQYFNLLWPACLGFWWHLRQANERLRSRRKKFRWGSHHIVLVCVAIMAACPIISTTRAGSFVTVISLLAAAAILWSAQPAGDLKGKMQILGFLGVSLGLGILLGWSNLAPRFESGSMESGWSGRNRMYELARPMADDYPLYGTGPGTFEALFQIYREDPNEYWPAQLHDDWLETLITFGWLGSIMIYAALGIVVIRWFVAGGIQGGRRLVMLLWVSLAGCLVHARYDFPFQMYSIVFLFLILCSILFNLSNRTR